jgi:hypothetical protein
MKTKKTPKHDPDQYTFDKEWGLPKLNPVKPTRSFHSAFWVGDEDLYPQGPTDQDFDDRFPEDYADELGSYSDFGDD